MSRSICALTLAAVTSLSANAFALQVPDRDYQIDPDFNLGDILVVDTGTNPPPSTGTHGGDPGCKRRCNDGLNQCQIDQFNGYRECRESAYEHVNWLIQYNGTIDFGLLQDMLDACDSIANVDGDLCGGEYEACMQECG